MIQIGDRVKCINIKPFEGHDNAPPLILNREYIVYDINKCSCGSKSYDVGLVGLRLEPSICICGNATYPMKAWLCNSKRFVKVQEQTKIEYKVVKIEMPKEDLILN